jgi:imidazolonepropionase-like amidohydrolase
MAVVHTGANATPSAVWLDERDSLFASQVGWFVTVRPGAEPALPALRAVEVRYRNAQAEAIARRLAPPAAPAIAITNAELFDSERGVVRPRTTIVVRGDRIVAVGPVDSVPVPAGARVVDAAGRTVVPGLWDMHGHQQLASQTGGALLQLAAGLTTVRDLAADIDVATSQRDRAADGRIVAPRLVLAGFMEGPGRWAGPSEVIVRTEDEARAWVARYDSLGYRQIKLYNLVHPDLIPTIAAEARRRGLRLSGHVPRGLTVPAAVQLGFDEINHGAFLFSTFHQDSLYLPTMRPYSAVAAAVAPHVDVDGAAMTAMIELFRARGTVIDGTFALWLSGSAVGAAVSGGAASADAARADANYLRLIRRLHDAGVTMVPGTDAGAAAYVPELEVYARAGIPAARVLQMATLVPARVMGDDREYGSVAPGKVADLVIVDGRPAERIGDLRRTTHVMRAGRLYDAAALRSAAGGGPRMATPATRRPR